MIKTSLMFGLLLLCLNTQAQGRWFNFGELDSLRKVEERPVLVFLEAEWCVYCKKMKREAFNKADIQEEIAARFWPVLLDIEDPQSYQFNGKLYSNTSELKYHQLAYLFTQQNEEPITPTFAIFNKHFNLQVFVQKYLSRKDIKAFLSKHY